MAVSARIARVRTAAWLGWQIESSWADPLLFFIYGVARPLAVALILAVMFRAVRGPGARDAAFAGFYVANAFHAYVNTVVVGMGWAVFEEREEFETLKYVCASPMGLLTYLSGRSLVKFALGTVSVALTLLLGWIALDVRWTWSAVHVVPLLAALGLGIAATLFTGFVLAGSSLVLTRSAMTVLDGATLGLYLLCGVIFPVDLLPRVLQWIAFALPFTWWYEAMRRFLLGQGASALLSRLSDAQLLAGLATVTVVFAICSVGAVRAFEHRARQLGRLDQTTLF